MHTVTGATSLSIKFDGMELDWHTIHLSYRHALAPSPLAIAAAACACLNAPNRGACPPSGCAAWFKLRTGPPDDQLAARRPDRVGCAEAGGGVLRLLESSVLVQEVAVHASFTLLLGPETNAVGPPRSPPCARHGSRFAPQAMAPEFCGVVVTSYGARKRGVRTQAACRPPQVHVRGVCSSFVKLRLKLVLPLDCLAELSHATRLLGGLGLGLA